MKKENTIEIKEEVKIGEVILEKGDKIEVIKEVFGVDPELNRIAKEYYDKGETGGRQFANAIARSVDDMSNSPFMKGFLNTLKGAFIGW